MGIPKTIRLNDKIEDQVEAYLKKNSITFPDLVNLALEKFISEPQTIELEPIDRATFLKSAKRVYKKHKKTMDKLK